MLLADLSIHGHNPVHVVLIGDGAPVNGKSIITAFDDIVCRHIKVRHYCNINISVYEIVGLGGIIKAIKYICDQRQLSFTGKFGNVKYGTIKVGRQFEASGTKTRSSGYWAEKSSTATRLPANYLAAFSVSKVTSCVSKRSDDLLTTTGLMMCPNFTIIVPG